MTSQLHRADRKGQSRAEKDDGAARGMVLLGSDERDESAENQSREKSADVGGIVGDAVRPEEVGEESPGEVEGDKYKQTSERAGQCGARHRKLTQLESCDERSGESEDSAGCSDAENLNVPNYAGKTGAEAADEIKRSEGPAAVKRFAERTQVPQAPHIEGNMKQAAMNEDAGQQPPPFA